MTVKCRAGILYEFSKVGVKSFWTRIPRNKWIFLFFAENSVVSVSLDWLLSGRNSKVVSGIQRGFDGESATLEDVGVDHGGF